MRHKNVFYVPQLYTAAGLHLPICDYRKTMFQLFRFFAQFICAFSVVMLWPIHINM